MGKHTDRTGGFAGRELCCRRSVDEPVAAKTTRNRVDAGILLMWEREQGIDVIQTPKEPELTPRECTGCWCAVRKG